MRLGQKTLVGLAALLSMMLAQGCSTGTSDARAARDAAPHSTAVAADEDITLAAPESADEARYSVLDQALSSDIAMVVVDDDGARSASSNADMEFPALSLIKLLLGYWVFENTSGYEDDLAYMIQYSDDATADYFDAQYPEAIGEVAEEFDLEDTARNGYWGNATTTAADLADFLIQLHRTQPDHPLFDAMANVAPVASDGYDQDFGTAVLPTVLGTKFGWSDDLSAHATISYGSDFVVVAAGYVSQSDLTTAVLECLDSEDSSAAADE